MALFGSSGIRTIFSRQLLDLSLRTGLAVGERYKNVIVGMDSRTSGPAMKHAVCAGILAAGGTCADAGIAPTPTIALATKNFDAGVMLTASHNPPEYNGLKLLNPDGSSFDTPQQRYIEEALNDPSGPAIDWKVLHEGTLFPSAMEDHISRIMQDITVKPGLKVVIDAAGGAASEITPELFRRLGCDVVKIHCAYNGNFPRPAEPVAANLKDLCSAVVETGAAIGIAHDGDADRMMAVDEKGRFITGDNLLALFIKAMNATDVVTTLDASMAVDELAPKVRRTRIGDTWVSEELRHSGDFGGETSGCWIFPAVSLCPDGIYAAAKIAELAGNYRLSELVDDLPAYPLVRGSCRSEGVNLEDVTNGLMALKPAAVDKSDGMKLMFDDGWVLVRPSGTEPKIRLTAEARTGARAQALYDAVLDILKSCGGKP